MKKIFLTIAIALGSWLMSQTYLDPYPDYYGYEYYDEHYSYPDDYYYNFPQDYYPSSYYEGYYKDYISSINNVNWNRFFSKNRLSGWQVQSIINLNNRFPSFEVWRSYYGMNPDRWYYDRFYELERILGPKSYALYQKRYYQGISPVVYFQNYRVNYYQVHYHVQPKYYGQNPIRYRMDRVDLMNSWKSTRNVAMLDTNSTNINGNMPPSRNQNMIRNTESNNTIRNQEPIKTNNVRNTSAIRQTTLEEAKDRAGYNMNNPSTEGGSRLPGGVREVEVRNNSSFSQPSRIQGGNRSTTIDNVGSSARGGAGNRGR